MYFYNKFIFKVNPIQNDCHIKKHKNSYTAINFTDAYINFGLLEAEVDPNHIL